ncbi:uncharacterized protein B0J16DRAFT_129653 [Fusarium flagelliforme]|uniref:5-methylcytosine g t mismatch-specific dna glycosylase n=1 Tax=Fusarium flagelliforme TaxID=2675880 RepID=A0A395MIT7_9HYPO|nr:uncharacterized protein B0J16DRAFT_129653 [Fusarium flagelliforme]KAH7185351.1 hypothetical protein B0J16DRAFT_129653 [Fusarium flagelliforme]RFN47670.1 5-methylcytosine g t mismatch-specific dna glycosylase [Fusarium flagelliforme]
MSSKDQDVEAPADERLQEKEKIRRSKSERKERRDRDRDHDRERDKDAERRRHRTSRPSRSKLGSEASDSLSHTSSRRHRHRKDRESDEHHRRHHRTASTSDLASSDIARTSTAATSILSDRISMPYPSFSKAHSKEAIVSRDSLSLKPPTREPPAPPTAEELTSRRRSGGSNSNAPPSPPPTDLDADKTAVNEETPDEPADEEPTNEETYEEETLNAESPRDEIPRIETPTEEPSASETGLKKSKSRLSSHSRSASRNEERSRVSRRSGASSQATYVKSSHRSAEKIRRSDSRASNSSHRSVHRTSSTRSHRKYEADGPSSPSSAQDSSPRTPTQAPFPHAYPDTKRETPSVIDVQDVDSNLHSKTATPASAFGIAPPPPPPPPALDVHDMPRVDYLLQNGGLAYTAPKNFLSVLPRQNGTRPSNPPLVGTDTLFAPFHNLLDQYNTVLSKQGSIAVATGHRSVARRLLDRLENVFSRDLPPYGCTCVMCDNPHEIHDGLNWGDVLEWVSGRIELPQWPPFDLAEVGTKAAEISGDVPPRPASPVQLDPDIAEEFREHYLRQSKKVRTAVDRWLSNTGETPVPPPQDVDDETLSFAILTNLDAEDRPYFNAIMTGSKELKSSVRAPTPGHRPRTDFLIKTGLALQRLYRLQQVPRDAESATYLVKNPHTHDLLVALSNINNSEWEILISGRFDGFLWSGADDEPQTPHPESRGPTPASSYYNTRTMSPGPRASSSFSSRNTTPFSVYSRGTTPASFVSVNTSGVPGSRQAVSNDEEMEMAAIAEIEREIYKGMETLEDAFEKLHKKAEVVRNALRQRGAGLMQNLQNRRRIDVLSGPNSGNSQSSGYERPAWAGESDRDPGSDDDWALDDIDIMPDDSASNISSSRHRRPKRRTERRTPAPINEEDED